jgi:hypothetical protein
MPVGAQVTYDYTGQPMTLGGEIFYEQVGIPGSPPCCEESFTMPYSVLGDVVLSQALNPNQANQQVVPLAYAFNNPGLVPPGLLLNMTGLLNSNYTGVLQLTLNAPVVDFSTANGRITAFSATFSGTGDYGYETLTLSSAGDSYASSEGVPDCMCGGAWNGSNTAGGTWTKAPEINPGVATTALTLLCGFTLILKARGVRS